MPADGTDPRPFELFIPDPPGPDDDRFSNPFKSWREWNTAVDFLTNLHCGAQDHVVFCVKNDPPDVVYEAAQFEIKEIMDEGRLRHDEVKALKPAGGASATVQLLGEAPPLLTPSLLGELATQCMEKLQSKGRYSNPEARRQLDLLLYVNLIRHCFEDGPVPEHQAFDQYGWRSVSVTTGGNTSLVLSAADDAPSFLRTNIGLVRTRWEPF